MDCLRDFQCSLGLCTYNKPSSTSVGDIVPLATNALVDVDEYPRVHSG